LIKYIKSVLWRVAKCLSYIEEARCLKVKNSYLLCLQLSAYSGSLLCCICTEGYFMDSSCHSAYRMDWTGAGEHRA